jgi:hypothetical protein
MNIFESANLFYKLATSNIRKTLKSFAQEVNSNSEYIKKLHDALDEAQSSLFAAATVANNEIKNDVTHKNVENTMNLLGVSTKFTNLNELKSHIEKLDSLQSDLLNQSMNLAGPVGSSKVSDKVNELAKEAGTFIAQAKDYMQKYLDDRSSWTEMKSKKKTSPQNTTKRYIELNDDDERVWYVKDRMRGTDYRATSLNEIRKFNNNGEISDDAMVQRIGDDKWIDLNDVMNPPPSSVIELDVPSKKVDFELD